MAPKSWLGLLRSLLLYTWVVCLAGICVGCLSAQDQPPGGWSSSGYYIRRTQVYYHPGFGIADIFAIPAADVPSFKILNTLYALDASRVYLRGVPIPLADPSTFVLLSGYYSRDARYIYVGDEIFSDDLANFEIIDGTTVRDSRHIYWAGRSISDDPSHFVSIGTFDNYIYLKDSQIVFVNGNPIPNADPTSFQVIAAAYSRDAVGVFYFNEPISDVDPATFAIVESPYARDAQSVFWMGKSIPNADPKTFRVLNKNFECSTDAAHAYYRNNIIQNVDASAIPPDAKANNCSEDSLSLDP